MFYYVRKYQDKYQLTTSYKDANTAKRIANQEKSSTEKQPLWEGEIKFNTETGKFGAKVEGVRLISHMRNDTPDAMEGRFAIFSIQDGKPEDLGVRFPSMSAANTFMKAVATAYRELIIVELDVKPQNTETDGVEIATGDTPPWEE